MPSSKPTLVLFLTTFAALFLISVPLIPGVALAQTPQTKCLEGRTATGQCVDAALAATVSQIATIFSQQAISTTAYPVLPSDDINFRYPDQLIPTQNKPSGSQFNFNY